MGSAAMTQGLMRSWSKEIRHSDTRVTGSSRRNEQWTQVPLLAKLLKLLICEINNIIEEANDGGESGDEDEDEWDDDSQESDTDQTSGKQLVDLSTLLAPAEDYLDDEEEDDPDCKADPIYNLDLKQYLVNFIREFSAQPYF